MTEYTSLLLNSINKRGDAILSSDDNFLGEVVLKKIWTNMRSINGGSNGRPAFYYSATEAKDVREC